MDIKGGCLCGAVRYAATVEQATATVCHCRDCQKFTGSAFATLVAVPKEALTIDGSDADLQQPRRQRQADPAPFLSAMRRLARRGVVGRPGMLILNVGTFDDPQAVKPGREIFRDDALPWVQVEGDVPRFAKRPT